MSNLFTDIDEALEHIREGWTTPKKAKHLAAAVIALQPKLSVEIGVFAGKGVVSLGLAHKYIGSGTVIGIDPFSADASAEGQVNEVDTEYWQRIDHNWIYSVCTNAISRYELNGIVHLIKEKSQSVHPPEQIGILRIDGNHGEAVLLDVERFAPKCLPGALLFLDDVGWTGNFVKQAADNLKISGWVELYQLEDGLVFQKSSATIS